MNTGIWNKYEKAEIIKTNYYLRIYNAIKKSNKEEVIIKEYSKHLINQSIFNSIKQYYKFENSITLLEAIDEKKNYYLIVEKGFYNLENYLNKKSKPFSAYNIKKILNQLNDSFKIMQNEGLIYGKLEPSDIIIFINDIDQFTFKLSHYNNYSNEFLKDDEPSSQMYNIKVLSPEFMKDENLTNKTDIWSLGIIIYFMAFKEYPFNAKNEFGMIQTITSKKNLIKKTKDDDLNDLISKMLKEEIYERISWDDYFKHSFFKKQFPQENINQGNDILLTIKQQVNDIYKNNIDINILKLGYETQIEKLNLELKQLKENNKNEENLKNQLKIKDDSIKQIQKQLDDQIRANKEMNSKLMNITKNYTELKRKYEKK